MTEFFPSKQGLYDPELEKDCCGVGLIASINGTPEHKIVRDAIDVLGRLNHRGACGSDINSGDGVGLLVALPHEFFREIGVQLFDAHLVEGQYAAGLVFLPAEHAPRQLAKDVVARLAEEYELEVVGWRDVPIRDVGLGAQAKQGQPFISQLFVRPSSAVNNKKTVDRNGSADTHHANGVKGGHHHGSNGIATTGENGHASAADKSANGHANTLMTKMSTDEFERRLYLLRKRAPRDFRADNRAAADAASSEQRPHAVFYFASLSSRTIVYKGQLTCGQFRDFFADLEDPRFKSHVALVHSRFSTNTFPSWPRAQPNRFTCHNGEINTVRGNTNWMRARQGSLSSPLFEERLAHLFPIIEDGLSDSGALDSAVEFLVMTGRSLPEVMMMLIPEAWQNDTLMDTDKRDFYRYHSALMEPWDGPAMFGFCDGRYAGAVLDRNGLRPARYYITDDDRLIFGSEVGILDVPAESVKYKGRLEPGKMLLVDFKERRIVGDAELKERVAAARPYGLWLKEQEVHLEALVHDAEGNNEHVRYDVNEYGESFESYDTPHDPRMRMFDWTTEHVHFLISPMGVTMDEALGSMGNDEALACMSSKPRVLYEYFKQLFAQVTNPPIDPIREGIVMSLECFIGPEGNLCETTPAQCHRLAVKNPVLSPEEIEAIRNIDHRPGLGWRSRVIDMTFSRGDGPEGAPHDLQ